MLARPEKFRCIECNLAFGEPGFACLRGDMGNGPAYWTDRGVLCGPACSMAHFATRRAEGTLQQQPARNPMTGELG